MIKTTASRFLFSTCLLAISWISPASASCSVHDHNCLHGVYPLDPALGNIPSGPATLQVITGYGGAPDVDLNQHVGLPPTQGPFVASNPDGNPIEATPLGGGPNVIYHAQQTVQYANGSAGGQLSSSPGNEQTDILGNVAEGTYSVAVYNYDIDELGLSGGFSTGAIAGGAGHFDAPSQSHVGSAFVQSLSLLGGSLAPDQAMSTAFNYYNNGFSPHAQGIYLIPGGTWTIGGVSAGQVSQFSTLDHSAGFITYGGQTYNSNPYDLQAVEIYGYGDYLVDPNTGLVLSTSTYQGASECGNDGFACTQTLSMPNGVVTDPFVYSMLSAAASVPGQIQESYGDAGKAHAWDYYHGKYDEARRLLNCPECNESQLLEIANGKRAGLTVQQQNDFDLLIAQAYSGQKYYDELKSQKKRGLVKLGVYLVVAAAVGDIATAAAEFSAFGATSAEFAFYSAEIGAVAGGAAAGFTGTYLATGDFDAALKAGVTGGAFAGVDVLDLNPWLDTGAKSILGGASAEWNGGEFKDGFQLVAATTGAQNLYEYTNGFGINLKPGNGFEAKDDLDRPTEHTNSFGVSTTTPNDPCWYCEGSAISKAGDKFPFFHPTSKTHDNWMIPFKGTPAAVDLIANFTLMPPALGISILGSLAPVSPVLISVNNE